MREGEEEVGSGALRAELGGGEVAQEGEEGEEQVGDGMGLEGRGAGGWLGSRGAGPAPRAGEARWLGEERGWGGIGVLEGPQ